MYSVMFPAETAAKVVLIIKLCILQILESETDNEARFRSLVSVGTLVSERYVGILKLRTLALSLKRWFCGKF